MIRVGIDFSHAGVLVAAENAGGVQVELPMGIGGEAMPQLTRMLTVLAPPRGNCLQSSRLLFRWLAPRLEKYAAEVAWSALSAESNLELRHEVAGLPSELEPADEEAKRFDLLVLNLLLAMLRAEPRFKRLRKQVADIAGLLEEQASIPMVVNRWS